MDKLNDVSAAFQADIVAGDRTAALSAVAEKLTMMVSAKQVPQLEKEIAALNGQEFGSNSAGHVTRKPAA